MPRRRTSPPPRASQSRPASTCRIRWPRRRRCPAPPRRNRSTWSLSSPRPARCWPWWSARRVRPRPGRHLPARLHVQGGHRLGPGREGDEPGQHGAVPQPGHHRRPHLPQRQQRASGHDSLQTAFAVSCNSTFAMLAYQRLGGSALVDGGHVRLQRQREPGHPRHPGPVHHAASAGERGRHGFGQGTDLVNPLSQASVAAAIADGTWRSPVLVTSPQPRPVPSHPISPVILGALRPMMRAVVTSGTAAGVGFPAGVYGKTGTAQYGTGTHSHGWFIGYRGDVAFAVLVEGGASGRQRRAGGQRIPPQDLSGAQLFAAGAAANVTVTCLKPSECIIPVSMLVVFRWPRPAADSAGPRSGSSAGPGRRPAAGCPGCRRRSSRSG